MLQGAGDAGGEADEPELRRALRQRRLQEKHERMKQQVRWGERGDDGKGGELFTQQKCSL